MTKPKKIHTYAYNIGRMDGVSSQMTATEFGVFQRLINKYYLDGHLNCDFDECCNIAGCRSDLDVAAVERVLKKSFKKKRNGYAHTETEAHLQKMRDKSVENVQKSANAASIRWEKDRLEKLNRFKDLDAFECFEHATSMPVARIGDAYTEYKIHSKKEEKELSKDNPSPPLLPGGGVEEFGFDQFFAAYPNQSGRFLAAAAWRKLTKDMAAKPDDIRRGLVWWIKRWSDLGRKTSKIPDPCNWLMDRKWQDAPAENDSSANVPVARWSGPEHVRRRVWELGGQTAVASYLDSAAWDGTDTIITRFGVAADRLKALLGNEFNVVVKKDRAA